MEKRIIGSSLRSFLFLGLLAALTLLSACSKTTQPPAPSPSVTSISPTSGPIGTTVTITGLNFSATAASDVVKFNGTQAVITSASTTSITAVLPAGATTGTVTVSAGDGAATGPVFTVEAGSAKQITAFAISSLSPPVNGVIDQVGLTITLTVPNGTAVTALIPTITLSSGATVSPASGIAQDFSSPVIYTVTGADQSTQSYTITVTTTASTAASWTQPTTLNNQNIYSLVVSGAKVFAGTGAGLFVSADNGITWATVAGGLPSGGQVNPIAASGNNLFIDTSSGSYYSNDNGTTWTQAATQISSAIFALAMNGSTIYAGTQSAGVFSSTDNGTTWTAVNTGLPASAFVDILTISGNNIFANVEAGNTPSGVFLSTNAGSSWTAVNSGLPSIPNLTSLGASGSNIFAGITETSSSGLTSDDGLYLSSNNGTSWAFLNTSELPPNLSIVSIAASGNNLFVGTVFYGIYHSTDNGKSWEAMNNGIPSSSVNGIILYSMTIIGNTLIVGDGLSSSGVYVTSF